MQQQRHQRFAVLALALVCVAALCISTTSAKEERTCSTPAECCQVCGDDSYRCARGPCVKGFIPKLFSISIPKTNVGFWDVVLSFYSMVPFFVPIGLALAVLFAPSQRTWTNVFALLFVAIVALITDGILVPSLGDCPECLRPCGTCIDSNGLPSGHATNAVGLCLWIILETLCGIGRLRRWTPCKRAAVILFSILLFAPVPYSRLYVGDHKPLQLIVGSADGILLAFLFFVVMRYVVAKRLKKSSQSYGSGCCSFTIINDFSGSRTGTNEEQLLGHDQTPVTAV